VLVYDVELFDVAGLRSFGGDIAVRVGSVAAGAGLDRTGASVGSVTTWSARGGVVFESHGALVATLAHEVVALGSVSSSTSAGVSGWMAAAPRVTVRSRVHGIRLAGTGDPGADVDVSVELAPARFLAVAIAVAVDRRYGASPSVAVTARLGAPLDVVVGFDEASATVYGGLVVRAADVRVAASVWSHELLGLSRGVSLAWEH
jgi:hypothetical protein